MKLKINQLKQKNLKTTTHWVLRLEWRKRFMIFLGKAF